MEYEIAGAAIDTTFVDLSINEIKMLHDKIFGVAITNESFMETVVKLELAYIPFFFLIIILVVAVNYRWNRSFERISNVYETMPENETHSEKFGMLKMQKRNLLDRLFVYLVIWGASLYIDSMMMAFSIFDFPYASIPMVILVIYKKMSILINTSSLIGYDDTDIKVKFDGIIDKMILNPIIDGISARIKSFFNEEGKNNKNKDK